MNEPSQPSDEDESVREAAEHAARSVQERREMARDAVRSEDPESDDPEGLREQSDEHGRASHAEEARSEEAAQRADDEQPGDGDRD